MLSDLLLHEMGLLSVNNALPLHRCVYEVLRKAIMEGIIPAGDRLPSNRELASDLKVSRNTIAAALTQLTVEGYIHCKVGSGTYVSESLQVNKRKESRPPETLVKISKRGQALEGHFDSAELEVQPLSNLSADFSSFPIKQWQRLQNKYWRTPYPHMLDYVSDGGYAPLRKAVAHYLRVSRGVQVEPDQIIITTGTQQSLMLCSVVLADPFDTVWMEDPVYWGAWKVFTAAGLQIHPIGLDEDGMAPQAQDQNFAPRLIYTTPSHQYPTGTVMSLARRHQILQLAHQHQAWLLEDDYDSEYRFSGPPLSSLAGLDPNGRVLYMGTFSKVLFPGIKLGYLVVPKTLVKTFKVAHYDINRPGQLPLQAALAEFIEMGHFSAALKKARLSYGLRRKVLLASLEPCLAHGAVMAGAEQGLHLCIRLPSFAKDYLLAQQLEQQGVIVRPLSSYCIQKPALQGLVVGYGYATPQQISSHGPLISQAVIAHLNMFKKS